MGYADRFVLGDQDHTTCLLIGLCRSVMLSAYLNRSYQSEGFTHLTKLVVFGLTISGSPMSRPDTSTRIANPTSNDVHSAMQYSKDVTIYSPYKNIYRHN